MPDVAVIIPAYNAARFIRDTLESVLAQDHAPAQVVVVDDGSVDGTAEIARSYGEVQVICRKNGGDAAARNTGLRETQAEFVVFLDHDDVLHANGISTHLAAFQDDIDMVFGSNDLIDSDGKWIGRYAHEARRFSGRDVVLGTTPSFSACMYRRSALARIGGLRDIVGSAADHDLNIRLLKQDSRGFCHGRNVMSYRLHMGQQTKSPARLYKAQMSVIEEHLGPGGIMEDAELLKAARRHWARYFGQFIPQEIVRAFLAGRRAEAAKAARLYLTNAPETVFGSVQFATKRLGHMVRRAEAAI